MRESYPITRRLCSETHPLDQGVTGFTLNELLKATDGYLVNAKKNLQIKGISTDTRTIKSSEAFIAIKGNNFDGHDFIEEAIRKGAACIIAAGCRPQASGSKIQTAFMEVKDTVKALGDIARYHRKKFDIPVIALTGSNGKTTTKEMIAWLLSGKYNVLKNEGTQNNHIGLPSALLNLNNTHDIAVLELGTSHFGEIEYLARVCQANIGVIINVGPAHLEFLCDLRGVFKEKSSLLNNLGSPHLAILNADDALLGKVDIQAKFKSTVINFGICNKSDFFASEIKFNQQGLEFQLNFQNKNKFTLKTLGFYNVYNALAAVSVARLFGLDCPTIAQRLASFDFPWGRLKFMQTEKTNFLDDTYNSNPLSLKQAIETLAGLNNKGRKIFVMGDMLELGKEKESLHFEAGQNIIGACDTFIAVGALSQYAAEAARNCGFNLGNLFTCESSLQAREILFNKISPGKDDVVLVKGSRGMKMEEIFNL